MTKILLAEDDKFLSRAYKEGLEQAGFTVVLVMDGSEIVGKAAEEKPDLILLDLVMPGDHGTLVLEKLKENEKTKEIPVIVLSNSAREFDIEETKKLGAIDYLIKSDFSMAEVVAKIKKHLGES